MSCLCGSVVKVSARSKLAQRGCVTSGRQLAIVSEVSRRHLDDLIGGKQKDEVKIEVIVGGKMAESFRLGNSVR